MALIIFGDYILNSRYVIFSRKCGASPIPKDALPGGEEMMVVNGTRIILEPHDADEYRRAILAIIKPSGGGISATSSGMTGQPPEESPPSSSGGSVKASG